MPVGGDDTDLLCVEVSALAQQAPTMQAAVQEVSCNGWQQKQQQQQQGEEEGVFLISSADQAHKDLLTSVLVKVEEYRPLQTSLRCMEDPEFLDIRGAVVNWFDTVSVSYGFVNETVVAALSHFDRYVSLTVTPIRDHMLLQLAAYVALLIASKMCETCPLRMKSLANLTGRMFTPLQVKRVEMDMISKLSFRLAPPSADEALHCLSALLDNTFRDASFSPSSSSSSGAVPHADILSVGSQYLKKARVRTCWLRHSPYTLTVAALATTYNSLGLPVLRRRLLRESDARARVVTGSGVDMHGVAACADAMASDERASAAIAAAAAMRRRARGSTESPVCSGDGSEAEKEGWGSPTGVAQGAAELLRKAAFSTVGGREGQGCTRSVEGGRDAPLAVANFSPPRSFSPFCPVPIKVATAATSVEMVDDRHIIRRVSSSPCATAAGAPRKKPRVSRSPRDIAAPPGGKTARRVHVPTSPLDVERAAPRAMAASAAADPLRMPISSQPYPGLGEAPRGQGSCGGKADGGGGQKRRLHQSVGSCFVPCARRRSVEGKMGRRLEIGTEEHAI